MVKSKRLLQHIISRQTFTRIKMGYALKKWIRMHTKNCNSSVDSVDGILQHVFL